MRAIVRRLDAFWFADGSAQRLAVLRILVGTAALAYLGSRYRLYTDIAASSPTLFEPVGIARLLQAPIPAPVFRIVLLVTLVANVAFIVGWRFRLTGPFYAALLLGVVSYRNSWSTVYHTDNLLILHVAILALTRSADVLSVDALRRATRGTPPPRRCWAYGYPIRLLCAVVVIAYVLSGIAKVAGPLGWGWAFDGGLRNQIGFDALRKALVADGAPPLAVLVYNSPSLSTGIGLGTLLLEIGALVAFFNRRLGWLWAVATFGMHWGIYAVMDIVFWYHLTGLAFAPFVVREGLIAWCGAHVVRGRRVLSGTSPVAPVSERLSQWHHGPEAGERR